MIDPAILSAYIASKVCHDLVSPLSSVVSAIDLLDDPNDSEMREQADLLLRQGARDASDRLQFLRYAFGSMGLNEGAADIHEAKSVTEKFVATHKPSVEWDIDTDHLSYSHARLMMNLLLMGMESAPRGGVITIRFRNDAAGLVIAVIARGVKARAKPDTKATLAGNEPDEGWTPRNVQPLFSKMIAEGLGGRISIAEGDEIVTITAEGIRATG
ncbi:MAG: histidine phosphotransferase family protein [Pseudomonadota bacterium]